VFITHNFVRSGLELFFGGTKTLVHFFEGKRYNIGAYIKIV
jgi:hypothetical protein